MTKLRMMVAALSLVSPLALVGCGEEAKVKEEKVISGPGGTSTITTEKKIESTGDNPPIEIKENAAPGEAPK